MRCLLHHVVKLQILPSLLRGKGHAVRHAQLCAAADETIQICSSDTHMHSGKCWIEKMLPEHDAETGNKFEWYPADAGACAGLATCVCHPAAGMQMSFATCDTYCCWTMISFPGFAPMHLSLQNSISNSGPGRKTVSFTCLG